MRCTHRSLASGFGRYIRDVKGKRSRTKNIWTQKGQKKIPQGLGPSVGHAAGWALADSKQHIDSQWQHNHIPHVTSPVSHWWISAAISPPAEMLQRRGN